MVDSRCRGIYPHASRGDQGLQLFSAHEFSFINLACSYLKPTRMVSMSRKCYSIILSNSSLYLYSITSPLKQLSPMSFTSFCLCIYMELTF